MCIKSEKEEKEALQALPNFVRGVNIILLLDFVMWKGK